MLASTQNLAPKPPALPPAAAPTPNPAGGPSFAQFLNGQASPPAPPAAHTEPKPAQPQAAPAPNPEAHNTAAPAPKPAARGNGAPNKADAKTNAKTDTKAEAKSTRADAAEGSDAKAVDANPQTKAKGDDDDSTDSPQLKEFTQLLGMAPAAAGLPDAAHAGHAAHAKTDPTADAAATDEAAPGRRPARGGPLGATARAATDAAEAPAAKAGDLRADKASTHTAATDLLQATSGKALDAQPGGALTTTDAGAPNFAAVLAQALPGAAAAPGGVPTPGVAQVQAPVHSQAFAPEVGARVSLLAADGVQQAELQLNPADMGPVAVQIVIDGSQAQVSFHAAQAETRQALQQSLPDLAAALQGQGLTLSGGGVFQQAPRDADPGAGGTDTGGGDAQGSGGGGSARVGTAGATAATAARRSVGLLDTFA